jgi:hypothetical protein
MILVSNSIPTAMNLKDVLDHTVVLLVSGRQQFLASSTRFGIVLLTAEVFAEVNPTAYLHVFEILMVAALAVMAIRHSVGTLFSRLQAFGTCLLCLLFLGSTRTGTGRGLSFSYGSSWRLFFTGTVSNGISSSWWRQNSGGHPGFW